MNLIWAPPVALVVKNLPANEGVARDAGLLPELGCSLGVGNDTSLQYSCLENFMCVVQPPYVGIFNSFIPVIEI